jgi:lambda repressor-like predicted transcriptional regulator
LHEKDIIMKTKSLRTDWHQADIIASLRNVVLRWRRFRAQRG